MKLIRAAQAAKIFGVHPDTIRNWDRKGALKPDFTTPSGHRLYSEERLLEIVKAGQLTSPEEPEDEPRAVA